MATACLLPLWAGAAFAQENALKGVALVIGQSSYKELSALPNPANDARAIDRLLTDLGFDVVTVTDADQKRLSRGLSRFAEDAEGADVALVYYSGHGIEAGGENFLVPVDAGVSSLDNAGRDLVPVSAFLAELQALVPVTIVLLDACRSNPFPPGSTITLEAGGEPAPVAVSGLGTPRGAAPLAAKAEAPAGLGAVIGFAAAPGHVALDGEVGQNSPYAAALLKHLAAGGYAFADVMTMVTEEVYLKTSARQTPWTNSSLRRTLFFGAAPEEGTGDDAAIRGERRKLLLTMASVGEAERKQVAAAAENGGVPMDALFAMLKAVGADTPSDPDALSRLLQEQAGRLKALLDEREAMKNADPEIQQLNALATQALAEGALISAIDFHERAKQRVGELAATVDSAEADLKAKRLEFAKVFADSAETYALSFDYARAAEDFASAHEQAARWDETLALRYRIGEAKALADLGYFRGDNEALERSAGLYRAMSTSVAGVDAGLAGEVRSGLANVLINIGERERDTAAFEEAASILLAVLSDLGADDDRPAWAAAQGDLAFALLSHGAREAGAERLGQAVEHLRLAIAATPREAEPLAWARLQNRLGYASLLIAQRRMELAPIEAAIAAFKAALEERRRDLVPIDWAQSTNNLAIALATIGEREAGTAWLEESAKLYRAALEVQTRERAPLLWAETQSNLGTTLFSLGGRSQGTDLHQQSAAAFRLALEEITRERNPLKWAALQDNLGLVLSNLGERAGDVATMRQAFDAFELALSERTRERVPLDWASTQNNLGNSRYRLGEATKDIAELQKAVTSFNAALEERTLERTPLDWARTKNNLGNALYSIGVLERSVPRLLEAAGEYRAALDARSREADPMGWARSQYNVGTTLLEAGKLGRDKAILADARTALEAARDVFLDAGQTQYAEGFAYLLTEVELAEAQADIDARLKAMEPAKP